jgi:AcrR family transcriptional regulator
MPTMPKETPSSGSLTDHGAKKPRPRGAAAVQEAIVEAATRLFESRSPQQVSLREIAGAAQVNYGQVYRHFKTKEAVLAAVFQHSTQIGEPIVQEWSDPVSAMRALRESGRVTEYARMIAWAVLDGADLDGIVQKSPTMERVLDLVPGATEQPEASETPREPFDPVVAYAASVTLVLGLALFEPYILQVTGLGSVDEEFRHDEFSRIVDSIMEGALA